MLSNVNREQRKQHKRIWHLSNTAAKKAKNNSGDKTSLSGDKRTRRYVDAMKSNNSNEFCPVKDNGIVIIINSQYYGHQNRKFNGLSRYWRLVDVRISLHASCKTSPCHRVYLRRFYPTVDGIGSGHLSDDNFKNHSTLTSTSPQTTAKSTSTADVSQTDVVKEWTEERDFSCSPGSSGYLAASGLPTYILWSISHVFIITFTGH